MNTKQLRRRLRLQGARILPGVLRVLPQGWGRELCAGIGVGGHWLVGRDRGLARSNLSRVYPEWSRRRVRREARIVFEEIGRNVFDFLRYPDLDESAKDGLIRIRGRDVLDGIQAEGRGGILVTAHLGCWEILAAGLVRLGYPLVALARPLREPRLEDALRAHRRRMGVKTVSSESLLLGVMKHLRDGGFVGILADQRVKRGGCVVRFLGQKTRVTEGPVRLAAASRAPIIPVGIHRTPDQVHEVHVLPPIPPGHPGEPPQVRTQQVIRALETLIREAPRQWIWIHPRWEGDGSGGSESMKTQQVAEMSPEARAGERELCAAS